MVKKELPFYVQTSILDEFIHAKSPKDDLIALEVIIDLLKSNRGLRDYFFRQGPNSAWAEILFEYGFFDNPPSPIETEEGYFTLPWWDVQRFLISIAGQVPDVAVKHVETIAGHPIYISRAISALKFVPPKMLVSSISRIEHWLSDSQTAKEIAWESFEIAKYLAESGDFPNAIRLFDLLTEPIPPSNVKNVGGFFLHKEAQSKFESHRLDRNQLIDFMNLFETHSLEEIIAILKKQLIASIEIEYISTDQPEEKLGSYWRSAIEDTDQDIHNSYKDYLLEALRDSLEILTVANKELVVRHVDHFLQHKHEIFRRLGIHMLHKFPDAFVPFVKRVLGNKNNLNDTGIHHEYFLLLQNGYPVLDKEGQVLLIKAILDGPPMDYVERLARWAEERHEENPKLYIDNQIKFWKRQRLWMLKEYLGQDNQQYLNELIEEFGEPEHPTFTHWVSGFQRVVQIAPISFDQLSSMSPHELLKFLNNWKPEDKRRSIFEEISYEGLALEVAKLIDSNYEYYQDYLGQIALIRPEFANSIFRFLIENKNADIPWEIVLDLMNYLLKDDSIRENMDRSFRVSWVDVRRSLVNLIEVGLLNEKRSIPMSELAKVKKILLILIHDPDPTNDSDQLEEGSFGYDDPITLAINHVRPNALIALMEYARFRSSLIQKAVDDGQEIDLSPRSLEIDVEQAITNKLDRIGDPSLAVHSVFGQHLSLLYWFNKDWVITHLDDILPEGSLEKSTRFFVAAWDSYVLHNHFYRPLFEIMRTKYELGIKNLVNGMVTKTHGNVSQHLAAHLFSDYIFSDYELHSAEGQNSLLVLLYEQPLPEAHSDLAGLLWRFASAHETDLLKYWPKIRSLWEWRVQKAAALNNPNTFDREMQFLAYLPGVAPLNETLDTMWALMIGLIPHISRSNNEFLGWRSLEKYLSKVVEYNPQKAVKFYRLMYEASPQNRRFSKRKEIDNIIEIAALNKDARQEVLNLIDVMARMGIHQYREVYFRLT